MKHGLNTDKIEFETHRKSSQRGTSVFHPCFIRGRFTTSLSWWLGVALLSPIHLAAQESAPPILDLLPESELGSLVFGNVERLRSEGDALFKDVGVTMPYRPSQLVDLGLNVLGVSKGFDGSAPVGLLFVDPEGHAKQLDWDRDTMLFAVPFKDRAQMAANVGLPADSRDFHMLDEKHAAQGFNRSARLTDHYLLLTGANNAGTGEALMKAVTDGPRLSGAVSAPAREQLNRADILLHLGAGEVSRRRPDVHQELVEEAAKLEQEDERRAAEDVAAAVASLRHIFLGVHVREGLATHTRFVFDPQPETAGTQLLTELRGQTPRATESGLSGLPDGPVIAAVSSRLSQPRQQLLARAFARLVTRTWMGEWGGLSEAFQTWSGSDLRQTVLLGALAEVAEQATEIRAALYPAEGDAVAVIVILKTRDPARLMATLRELSDFLVEGQNEAQARSAEEDAATLRRLIRELSADDFATRNRATTRLLLLGPRARPALEQAAKDPDRESAARAERLLALLRTNIDERERELIVKQPLASIHPRLTYRVAAERIEQRPVDVIELALPESEAAQQQQLQKLLGADWNRLRVATTADAVVLTLGTTGDRLAQTLENLATGKPGLAADPRVARLPEDPQRLLEAHLPVGKLVETVPYRANAQTLPPDPERPLLTAVGLSAGDSEVWVDAQLPINELREVISKRGW